ncbi:MAG TPA: hypothetical protein DCE03_02805 [Synergistaceae bacterium]|jgi:hypothetical protein|nr:MAG: hypothetical protein XD80_0006 [Synergistales bacterium 53_16]KUL04540.1 MAG: hypothetical protein XE12_0269 [Synergistales bacterium 54_9]MDN5336731.1 hypothetical protein [Synergistales bacterium]HAA47404.1 hypothetical protein [Synergistaceae bacterium]HAG22070.1 hypothetical protein [Synergistaceae bacterium]
MTFCYQSDKYKCWKKLKIILLTIQLREFDIPGVMQTKRGQIRLLYPHSRVKHNLLLIQDFSP